MLIKHFHQTHFRNTTHSANSLIVDDAFETSNLNYTNPGALPLRLCVWVWPGDHEDGRLAHVHLRHLLHTQALPREGGRF